MRCAGAREARILVDRKKCRARLSQQDVLGAVAMMHVEVIDGHRLAPVASASSTATAMLFR